MTLRWAIAPINRGLEPLDIARDRQVDLNTFTTIQGETAAYFATHTDPRGISLSLEPGDYWLKIVIYGENFKPVERGYAVHWDGKNYAELGMREMNIGPSNKTTWPYKLLRENSGSKAETNETEKRVARESKSLANGAPLEQKQELCSTILQRLKNIEDKIDTGSNARRFWGLYALGAAFIILSITLWPGFMETIKVNPKGFYIGAPVYTALGFLYLLVAVLKARPDKKQQRNMIISFVFGFIVVLISLLIVWRLGWVVL